MRALDLFCGAGGAARGYADAGFDVVGIDVAQAIPPAYTQFLGEQIRDWLETP